MSGKLLKQSVTYDASGSTQDTRGVLGAGLSADWRSALIARGLVWHVDVGAFSTPIVGGGNGTILDADQPELIIDVPTGWCCLLLRCHVVCQTPLIATDSAES
mgnify:CR=1 FL=1